MAGWKLIETAPTDGTWVLIKGGGPGYGWAGEEGQTPPMVVAQRLDGWEAGEWQFAFYDGGYYGVWENPTHWTECPDLGDPTP